MTSEPLPKAASVEYLTDALCRSGTLSKGRVCEIVVASSRLTPFARILRLRLAYDGAVDGPAFVVLKTGRPNRVAEVTERGRREVEFYTGIAAVTSVRLLPRCFAAVWDDDAKAWHLLLEDLTQSHRLATPWPLPPMREQCERILGALARFHAAWWDDLRLGVSIGRWLDADGMRAYLQKFAERYEAFAQRLGEGLSPERRDLYARFLAAAPGLLARYHAHRNLTVIHGDADVWRCLLPRDGGGNTRLIDWGGWRLGVASNDIASMMALHWYPERRRALEQPLLDHYHAALVEHGVRGYDRPALDDDYRFSTLWQLMTPVWQAAMGLPPVIWWNNLERILMAVDDLGCVDLLG